MYTGQQGKSYQAYRVGKDLDGLPIRRRAPDSVVDLRQLASVVLLGIWPLGDGAEENPALVNVRRFSKPQNREAANLEKDGSPLEAVDGLAGIP